MIDEGLANTFDSHVIAGYRFLMRYYGTGDRIYIFGFSRGAFTARFLARMITSIGLLSMGNEEMVPFAYKVYQDYETGVGDGAYMRLFKSSFCRDERKPGHANDDNNSGIKVHFLGLFDTVNSVGTLDVPWGRTLQVPMIIGTAEHVRHAVALDERRVKFKAALFAQDRVTEKEDIKEVWFCGNHGDVGGGWPAESDKQVNKRSSWRKFVDLFQTKVDMEPTENKESDYFQLSDIALKWMMDELDALPNDRIQWNSDVKCSFLERFNLHRDKAIVCRLHDTLRSGGGLSFGKVCFWNWLGTYNLRSNPTTSLIDMTTTEYLPFVKRWELYNESEWKYVSLPLNMGDTRDIPANALFHHSVIERLRYFSDYRPKNDIWIGSEKRTFKELNFQKHGHGHHRPTEEPHFVYQEELTIGSVRETENCKYPVGPQKTDRIYTVALSPVAMGSKNKSDASDNGRDLNNRRYEDV
jgi:Uncharacterized alpha/beta hydrolase domain (DUF2235)